MVLDTSNKGQQKSARAEKEEFIEIFKIVKLTKQIFSLVYF